MHYDEVVLGRRSTRGYQPDPVPEALIKEVIGMAMRAPSSLNTQPWTFYVITGAPLDRIRAGNECFRDIARVTNTAIRDKRNALALERCSYLGNG